mmetsp:Transcript_2341/g.4292  ORF Transcript_2341/g.4292 Transcript_2341/m.4292 type:complete len:567 (+) Transcript_2341:64-1764(+)
MNSVVDKERVFEIVLERIVHYSVGENHIPNHIHSAQTLVSLSRVSKGFNRRLREITTRSVVSIFHDITTVGYYGNNKSEDEEQWLPLRNSFSTYQIISTYIHYGGMFLIGISLCLRQLGDEILDLLARECSMLKRVEFHFSQPSDPYESYMLPEKKEDVIFFSTSSLINFFETVAPLSHVALLGGELCDDSFVDSVLTTRLIETIWRRHSLTTLALTLTNTMNEMFTSDVWEHLESYQISNPKMNYIKALNFTCAHDVYNESHLAIGSPIPVMFSLAPTYFSKLRSLTLNYCPGLTDEVLRSVTQSLPSLQYLQIEQTLGSSNNVEFRGISLRSIGETCSLKSLSIANQKAIGFASVLGFVANCRTLIDLNIVGTVVLGQPTQFKSRIEQLLEVAGPRFMMLSYTGTSYEKEQNRKMLGDLMLMHPHIQFVESYNGIINPSPAETMALRMPLRNPYHSLSDIVRSTLYTRSYDNCIEMVCGYDVEDYPDADLDLAVKRLTVEREKILTEKAPSGCGLSQCTVPKASFKCSACRRIKYCCAEHQRQDWSTHKYHCKALTKFPLRKWL